MYVCVGGGRLWICLYVYGSVFEKLSFNSDQVMIGNLLGNLHYRCKTKVRLMAKATKCERHLEGSW